MTRKIARLRLTAAIFLTIPAIAKADPTPPARAADPAVLSDEVAQLRAEVEALRAELRAMRGQVAAAPPVAAATPSAPAVAPAQASAPASPQLAKASPDAVQSGWKGAPEFKSASGWSFKPRGRIQIDGGYLDAPGSRASGQADGRGFTSRIRRVYLGAQGTIPGGFSYRADVDLAGNAVSWTDLYLTYEKGPFNVTVGQHHAFTSMEQLESDLYLSFTERAAFIGAFNLERRLGVSVGYRKGTIMANAGIFTDDMSALTNDGDKSMSIDGRLVWMPKYGDLQLHVAGSGHYRDLNRLQGTLGTQYRQRPYIATTDIRYVDTGILTVSHEKNYTAELAANWKRFHAVGEASWLKVDRPGDADPIFFGGYAEVGIFLTKDSRVYKNGVFDRLIPSSPLGEGGIGAIEINVRYDHLDLTDAGIGGGIQDGFGTSIVWAPNAYVRFIADYMHLIYDIPSAQPKFNAEVVGLRAQVDF